MITIDHINGYWTIVINNVPTLACVSFDSAVAWFSECGV